MDAIAGIEKYLVSVGLKRALAAGIGSAVAFMGTDAFIHALSVLQTVGITVTVDKAKFQTEMVLVGGMALTALHDYLHVKFPNIKWL